MKYELRVAKSVVLHRNSQFATGHHMDSKPGIAIDRALLLLQQRRFDLAEQELRRFLAADPHQFYAHALLSLTLLELNQPQEAVGEAQQAVHLAPDVPYVHFVFGRVLDRVNRLKEAEQAANEALRLDPDYVDAWALLAGLHLQQERWQAGLEAAERGLRVEPDHVHCNNLRARALIKLGRMQDSSNTLQAALLRDPENAYTHANRGWVEMERNNHQEAMTHFREALRLDPEMGWARQGIVEALKARNPLYRWLLQYFFWMSRLSGQARWLVIMGGYFGARIVGQIADSNPSLSPILTPLTYLYLIFAYLTWTGNTIFNLLLRLDRFGRLVLSEAQIRNANVIGGVLLLALLAFVAGWFDLYPLGIIIAIWAALMVIPLAATLNRDPGRGRIFLGLYTAGLALIGIVGFSVATLGYGSLAPFASLFMTGLFLFTILGNIVR